MKQSNTARNLEVAIPDFARVATRDSMLTKLKQQIELRNEIIRRGVLQQNRVDLLIEKVLKYDGVPVHRSMIEFRMPRKLSLLMAWRGCGKSTVLTIAFSIFKVLNNPNVRILIASKTQQQAESFLKEIKAHLEFNNTLTEVFGTQRDPNKWDVREINVISRTTHAKECTITCIGVGGALPGKHFDIVICDDLVDEENSRTAAQREKLKTWFYKVLLPTLEPGGELHIIGTRFHHLDLYGWLLSNEFSSDFAVYPSLVDGTSPWPEKFSVEWLMEQRKKMGLIFFESQYQQNVSVQRGRIYQWDWLQNYFDGRAEGLKWMGVDVSTGQSRSDYFAAAVVAYKKETGKFQLDVIERERLSFDDQVKRIVELSRRHKPVRVGIEANAAQLFVIQHIRSQERYNDVPVIPVYTQKDKTARAWALSAYFERGDFLIKREQTDFMQEMVQLPDGENDDMFDAVDIAHRLALGKVRTKKAREREPGLI